MDISLMNINISTFFEFPGILITIGLVLLIISIILIIIAYNTPEESVQENSTLEEKPSIENEVKKDITDEMKKVSLNKEEKSEVEEQEESKEKDNDDGFDLTKVFEISNDDEKGFSIEEVKAEESIEKEEKEDKEPVEKEDEEEEIELL